MQNDMKKVQAVTQMIAMTSETPEERVHMAFDALAWILVASVPAHQLEEQLGHIIRDLPPTVRAISSEVLAVAKARAEVRDDDNAQRARMQ